MTTKIQTSIVSDEAVQAAEEAVYHRHERGFLMKPLINPVDMRKALTAAYPHLSQIGTKPVDVAAVRDASFRQGLLVAANSCDRWADDLAGLVDSVEHHLRSKATAIRALSPAEPVDNEDEYDIHTYRELAAAAIEDLKNYAKDGDGSRLMVSHNSYLEDLARIDRAAPTSKGGE